MRPLHPFIILLFLLLSCGKPLKDNEEVQYELHQEQYASVFHPINKWGRSNKAEMRIDIQENQIWFRLFFQGQHLENSIIQLLHYGRICPTLKDDTNADGHLDFEEVLKVSGRVLIPLDKNLNTRFRSLHAFPQTRRSGKYFYSESAHYGNMIKNLLTPIDNESFPFANLNQEESFSLSQRVVILYGISEVHHLPGSFRSYSFYQDYELYPILCSKI